MIHTMSEHGLLNAVHLMTGMLIESPVYRRYSPDIDHTYGALLPLLRSDAGIFLTDSQDNPTGVMIGFISKPWYANVVEANEMILYIDRDFRGGSLAARLVKAFVAQAEQRGAQSVLAGASAGIDDPLALSLYARLGFRQWAHGMRYDFVHRN